MSAMSELATLRRLMPPTAESDTVVDWERMTASWGRPFPSDYRQFIDVYGEGAAANYLSVVKPEPKEGQPDPDGMRVETLNAEDAWTVGGKAPALEGTDPRLLAWAVDADADILCWDTSGDDPDAWPVLVFNRDDRLWTRHDCGAIAFLVRVLRAEYPECPLGGLALWGKDQVRYLNDREYRRLRGTGVDPWTGEPLASIG